MRIIAYAMCRHADHELGIRRVLEERTSGELTTIIVLGDTGMLLRASRIALGLGVIVVTMEAQAFGAAPTLLDVYDEGAHLNAHIILGALGACHHRGIHTLAFGPFTHSCDHPTSHEGFASRSRALCDPHAIALLDLGVDAEATTPPPKRRQP